MYIPLVLFVVALVTCFLVIDYIRRGEAARTRDLLISPKDNSGRCAAIFAVFR